MKALFPHRSDISIISDFDGVIAHSNTFDLLNVCYDVVAKYRPLDREWFLGMFKSLVPCPLQLSIDFLLESLDVMSIKSELVCAIEKIDGDISAALPFLAYCESSLIPVYVFSTGSKEANKYASISARLGADNVIASTELSKLNPETYRALLERLDISSSKAIYIDDCPVALHSAKLAGLQTAMLTNRVFTRKDAESSAGYIDAVFSSWEELTMCLALGGDRHQLGLATHEVAI